MNILLGDGSPIAHLVDIGIELSTENDMDVLIEKILRRAMHLTGSQGGTIYTNVDDTHLKFETVVNQPLGIYLGGKSGDPIDFLPLPLFINDLPNEHAIAAYCGATVRVINIPDAYEAVEYDMSASRKMDERTGFRTKSVLNLPMTNHRGDLLGVLQLINATNENGEVVSFTLEQERLIHALTSQAAIAMSNRLLIEGMSNLFDSLTKMIAKAIDEKSPYTGGHCRRIPVLTMMLATALHDTEHGEMASFRMSQEDKETLHVAGWLHDCGKIATPEYVMDKSTKLETIFDRVELVIAKIEIARRDIELKALKEGEPIPSESLTEIDNEISFIKEVNIGGEYLDEEKLRYLNEIAKKYQVMIDGVPLSVISKDELKNLSVARGTLTSDERTIINRHMDVTVDMLESLPFPKHLKNVPEYACGHHEKMDGTGYPKGLTKEEMSVPARAMAIADIFEALTASDRPYKPAKKISECINIMKKMCQVNHIDADIFEVFLSKKVYLDYANEFLLPEQIDIE